MGWRTMDEITSDFDGFDKAIIKELILLSDDLGVSYRGGGELGETIREIETDFGYYWDRYRVEHKEKYLKFAILAMKELIYFRTKKIRRDHCE